MLRLDLKNFRGFSLGMDPWLEKHLGWHETLSQACYPLPMGALRVWHEYDYAYKK